MKDQTKPVKGIRISRMSAAVVVLSFILYILLTVTVVHVSKTLKTLYEAMLDYTNCMQIVEMFRDGSDYLTEQARFYVSTADPARMDDYFTEVHVTGRREGAVEVLAAFELDNDTTAYLDAALDRSAALMEREIYAMALVSLAQGAAESELPREVRDAALTAEDRALSKEQLTAKATELVFGADYQAAKDAIADDVDYLLLRLMDFYGSRVEADYERLHRAVGNHQILIALHFAATMVEFAVIFLLVVVPLRNYVRQIEERKPIERFIGAYECKRVAQSYNTMLAFLTANEQALRKRAEHDALTGLLNRGAFDALQSSLENYSGPLALLLVDVDMFKQVNDGYGHETGDKVLKKVADLLSGNFRAADYPARIGGDEFAVIAMDAEPKQRDGIGAKIAAINEILTHPTDGLPVVSLSVGGAFSEAGFTENLYNDADAALYEVKEHGRCGCRFFNPEGRARG